MGVGIQNWRRLDEMIGCKLLAFTPSVPKKRVKSAGQTVHKKIVNLNHIDSYSRNRMNRERGWRIEKEERGIKEKQESPFPPNYLHGGAHT